MSSDPFFVTQKSKKRKTITFEDVSSNGKRTKTQTGRNKFQSGRKSEKLDQEEEKFSSEDDIGPGGIDDMDFNKDSDKEESSDDNRETPAEKRRRLAKQYIESVKEKLGKKCESKSPLKRTFN
jgi:ribosomal RNA-processing protein 9